jgi:hypothetical protein
MKQEKMGGWPETSESTVFLEEQIAAHEEVDRHE